MKKIILFILHITVSNLLVNAQYTKLFDFNGVTNGSKPSNDLFFDGNFFYGTTYSGGINDSGTVFKIKPDGTGYTKLLDFAGAANGKNPSGALISDNTFFYGVTGSGGINGKGVIFKIKPDGTSYTKLLDFAGVANGSNPWGSLIYDGTFLYGTTTYGGANNEGVCFRIKPNGTGYLKLLDFDSNTNGATPVGSLISDGTFLYGATSNGGLGNGILFKIKPDGTEYTDLHDFDLSGDKPTGSLISDGTFLYGMTHWGGSNNCAYGCGGIFKIKTDGTEYNTLLDFNGSSGAYPDGGLLSDGIFLYGMTPYGGTNASGNTFKIKTDGTEFTNLLNFAGISNGSIPRGSLVSDGTFLYGTTSLGGTNNMGTVFRLGFATNVSEDYTKLEFNVYPNPGNGTYMIVTNENNSNLIITNVIGENIYESEIKKHKLEIDLINQPRGIYFITIKTQKAYVSKKLIHK